MATLTNTLKNSSSLTGTQRQSDGLVFFAWLFWFTQPVFSAPLSNTVKNGASLTSILKN